MDSAENYAKYQGLEGELQVAAMPLERDTLRRFVQAIMDHDPVYYDDAVADASKFGGLAAPPLYPVHAFRLPADTPDPLDVVSNDPNADGTAGIMGVAFGLPPIEMPYRRLLNGGNEIELLPLAARRRTHRRTTEIRRCHAQGGQERPNAAGDDRNPFHHGVGRAASRQPPNADLEVRR